MIYLVETDNYPEIKQSEFTRVVNDTANDEVILEHENWFFRLDESSLDSGLILK